MQKENDKPGKFKAEWLSDEARDIFEEECKEYLACSKEWPDGDVHSLWLADWFCPWKEHRWTNYHPVMLNGKDLVEMAVNFVEFYIDEMHEYLNPPKLGEA